jgi:hypothetical protein
MTLKTKRTFLTMASMSILAITTGCTSNKSFEGKDMIGNWKGQQIGFEMGQSEEKHSSFFIKQANGQAFSGSKTWGYKGKPGVDEMIHGVIFKNGKVYIADEDGYSFGQLSRDGELSMVYLEASKDDSAAKYSEYTKQ